MHSLVAPVAFGQLWDSRGCKSTTIHPLQSLSAPLPGSETGPCQCSLLWQTHPLHLHGTPYKAPWDKVSFCLFFFLTFIFLSQYFHPGAACSLFSVTIHTNVCLLKASSVLLLKQPSQCPFAVHLALILNVCSHFLLQRELKISLLWYTCETRFPTQQTPGRHAVYGPQTTTCSAETEV